MTPGVNSLNPHTHTHTQRRRGGGHVSGSRNADFGDGSTISLFVLFMERQVKV